MFVDLFNKLKANKDTRFVLEKLVNYNTSNKIHIKNKNGILNIEIIKDKNNYLIIKLKGSLENFTDISVLEKTYGYNIYNSIFYINGDKYFLDEINGYTEISLNGKVIYIKKGTNEYFKDYKNDIIRKCDGKYTLLKYEKGKYKKYPTSESYFDDFIYSEEIVYKFRKKYSG